MRGRAEIGVGVRNAREVDAHAVRHQRVFHAGRQRAGKAVVAVGRIEREAHAHVSVRLAAPQAFVPALAAVSAVQAVRALVRAQLKAFAVQFESGPADAVGPASDDTADKGLAFLIASDRIKAEQELGAVARQAHRRGAVFRYRQRKIAVFDREAAAADQVSFCDHRCSSLCFLCFQISLFTQFFQDVFMAF